MKRFTSLLAAGALTLSMAACHNADADKSAAISAQQATIDSMKMEIAKQRVVDSMQGVTQLVADSIQEVAQADKEKAVAGTAAAAAASKTRRSKTRSSGSSSTGYNSGASYSNAAYEPAPVYEAAPVTPAKRGWSAKAKGAVIGAGAGAVGGAIINKRNRGAGAVIGGLGGAAIGTGVGAILDRKNGR